MDDHDFGALTRFGQMLISQALDLEPSLDEGSIPSAGLKERTIAPLPVETGQKDVAQEPYIMLTVDEAAATANRYWRETEFNPSIIVRTFSVEAVRSMVANGHGVAILSDMVRRPWSLEGKRIETIDLSDVIPPMDIGLAWRRDMPFTTNLQAFRAYFRQAFNLANGR